MNQVPFSALAMSFWIFFAPCDSEDSARELASRYDHLILHADGTMFLVDDQGSTCRAVFNEIVILHTDGAMFWVDTHISGRITPNFVSEYDIKSITRNEMIGMMSSCADEQGLITLDSIAYDVVRK